MSDVSDIKAIIWDLDNTLYRFTKEFKFSCNIAAAKAAIELGFDKPYEETLEIAVQSSKEHHFSLYVFLNQYGMNYKKLHHLFHDYFDAHLIEPIDGVIQSLETLDLPQVILTNGSRRWAKKALAQIQVSHLFDDHQLYALEDVDMVSKVGGTRGYETAINSLDEKAETIVILDDLDRNLEKAKEVNLQTAYIHHDDPLDTLPHFIDYQYRNPIDFIKVISK